MDVERFVTLAERGYNVPRFVVNPVTHYGRDAYLAMKDYFQCINHFDVLVTRKDKYITRFFEDVMLGDAILRLSHLEMSSYDGVLMESTEPEWDASVSLYGGESGKLKIFYPEGEELAETFRFHLFDEIPDLVHRHVVRTCQTFLMYTSKQKTRLTVRWATDFVGVNFSKLVFLDFVNL